MMPSYAGGQVAVRRLITLIALVVFAGGVSACSEDAEYVTIVLQRPVDFAITCVSSDYSFLDVEKCAEDTSTTISWILDDDMGGVFVANARTGKLIDMDAYFPGYSPVAVGTGLTRIVASPDSRDLYAAYSANGGDGPGIARIPGVFYEEVHVSARMDVQCPVTDMIVIRDQEAPAGWYVAAVMRCDDGFRLARLDPTEGVGDAFMQITEVAPLPGTVGSLAAGAGKVILTSSDLPAADGYPAWDHMLVFNGPLAAGSEFVAVPVVNDSVLAPMAGTEGLTRDCIPGSPAVIAGYVSGRPAISPDGRFIYVPMSSPAGLAVFDASLERVDTHALTAADTADSTDETGVVNFANRLFGYMGYKDIRMDSPVVGVTFVEIPEVGLRALTWLYGGQVVRVVVDPTEEVPWSHRAENDLEGIESSAYQPILWYQGQKLANGIKTRSDLPSFGSRQIVMPVTEDDSYVYYGIQFNGDVEAEAPERWSVTFEGVIPGASGVCGVLESAGTDGWLNRWSLSAGEVDFCALGIEAAGDGYDGDLVEVTLPVDEACGSWSGRTAIFRVETVEAGQMGLIPADATAAMDTPPAMCAGSGVAWKARVSGQWLVSGSRSGFLHPFKSEGGQCVVRPDADPAFVGRALTAMPDGDDLVVDSCPVARGLDSRIDWDGKWFHNAIFGFWVIPGCVLDNQYRPVVIPPVRDTSLTFLTETGRIPNQNDIGGLASAMLVHGATLFALDSSNGRLVVLDPASMEIKNSWF